MERSRRFFAYLILALGSSCLWAGSSLAAPCAQSRAANEPVNGANLKALATAAKAAEKELPDAPSARLAKKPEKLHWFRISYKAEVNSGIAKPQMVDIVSTMDDALSDPKNPNYNQAVTDIEAGIGLYSLVTGNITCSTNTGGGTAPGPTPTPTSTQPGGGGGIFVPLLRGRPSTKQQPGIATATASGCVPSPTNINEFTTLLQKNASSLTFDAKVILLSALGDKLDQLYNFNALNSVTPLPEVFSALKNDTTTAGVCRDIHEFLARAASALGLKDAGTTGLDWDNSQETGAHVVAQFRDPKTGNFVYINYNRVVETDSKYLTEAAQEENVHLAAISGATDIETGADTGKLHYHQMQSPRTHAIFDAIDHGSDLNEPNVDIALSQDRKAANLHVKLAGGDKNRIGVFAVAVQNTEELPVRMAAGGLRMELNGTKQLTRHTALEAGDKFEAGAMVVRAENPLGERRQEGNLFGATDMHADVAWKGDQNQGKVGVRYQAEGTIYLQGIFGFPFNILSIEAEDSPSKNVTVHARSDYFGGTRNTQDIGLAVHHLDDQAGVTVRKKLAGGKIELQNDVTVHAFGGVGTGAYGIHDDATVALNTARHGKFTVGGDVGKTLNHSGDVYYDYAPVVCKATAGYEKKLGRVEVDAKGEYNCNRHNEFTLMQQDSEMSDPEWTLTQPKVRGGVTIRW